MRPAVSPDLTEAEAVEIAEEYEDRIPTIDDVDLDKPPPATYRDWRREDTRVVTYTTRPDKWPKDLVCSNRLAAKAHCIVTHGRPVEENYLPERFFFRVRRSK